MRKLYCFVTAGLMAASFAGCSRGWPSCFNLLYRTPETQEMYYDEACESCGAYHGETDAEWVPATPATLEPLPTRSPANDDSSNS